MSPSSGFHHAMYSGGGGFCTFSSQVLASLKLYNIFGLRGCYFDLDGHYGNSIESYREKKGFENVNKVIPRGCNVNPKDRGQGYIEDLYEKLNTIKNKIKLKQIDYVVWCHGADSHEDDPLGGELNTEQWLRCTKMFVEFIKETEEATGKIIPITIALFGGYQKDYNKVLELHKQDLEIIINGLTK